MFVKYVYDHNNDVWISGLGFLGRSNHWYKKHTSRFKVGGDNYFLTKSGPKRVKELYDIIILRL